MVVAEVVAETEAETDMNTWLRRHWAPAAYLVGQIVAFVGVIWLGTAVAPELRAGAMDWIVTGAYGAVVLIALMATALSHHWRTHACVQSLAAVYGANVLVSYFEPGFIAHGPWVLLSALVWCCIVQKYRLACLIVPGIVSSTVMFAAFGPSIQPGAPSYWYEVVNNLLFVVPLLYAGASVLGRDHQDGSSATTAVERRQDERKAA